MTNAKVARCEQYGEYAHDCLRLAAATNDEVDRQTLRKMAAEWVNLAEDVLAGQDRQIDYDR